MRNISKKLFAGIAIGAAFLPLSAFAQVVNSPADNPATFNTTNPFGAGFSLVPCSGAQSGADPLGGKDTVIGCDFAALMIVVQRFINLLLYATTFIAIILIVFAGFKYLTAGGDTSKTTEAKKIFKAIAIGMIIAFTSWVVVNTIVTQLGILNPDFQSANPLQKQ
jgi:hypothetical protein